MSARTHYDVLGVAPSASPTAIREAYRRLAREHHPDRTHGSPGGGDRMPLINEAYRVLSDPARRAVYDAELRPAGPRPGPAAPLRTRPDGDEEPTFAYGVPQGPARVPWRGLLVASAIAIVAIVVLAQFTEPGTPPGPDGILRNGDCVELLDNGDVREIGCGGVDDLVVRDFVTGDDACPSGLDRYRDRQGLGYACVVRETAAGSS